MDWLDDFIKRLKSEFYNDEKGLHVGECIAFNLTNLAVNVAKKSGQDEWAKKIEEKRQDVMNIGRGIDDKFKEEYMQYQESDGFSQYVAGNVVSLAKIGAELLNKDKLAKKIEEKRQDVVNIGRGIDDKFKEEYKQYQESDGFSQYVAGNVVSLAKIGAELLNKDEWAKKIEEERKGVMDVAKKIDDKVKEEYEKIKKRKKCR